MVGDNVRALREFYGHTQKDLAEQMNCGKDYICKLENHKIAINMDTLKWLAQYYRVSVDDLINGDFTYLKKGEINTVLKDSNQIIKVLFPIVKSESAMQSKNFRLGYDKSKKLMEKLVLGEKPNEDWFEEAIDYYSVAWEEEKCKAAIVNLISLLLLCGSVSINPGKKIIEEKVRNNEKNATRIIKQALLIDPQQNSKLLRESEKIRKEFFDECREALDEGIRTLKKNSAYAELGDFFIAVNYLVGLGSLSHNMNKCAEIGQELMETYARLGNKYAKRVLRVQNKTNVKKQVA